MRDSKRMAVIDACFCVNRKCAFHQTSHWTGATEFADCRREMCDNHRRGNAPLPPLLPDEPPFALPEPNSTQSFE